MSLKLQRGFIKKSKFQNRKKKAFLNKKTTKIENSKKSQQIQQKTTFVKNNEKYVVTTNTVLPQNDVKNHYKKNQNISNKQTNMADITKFTNYRNIPNYKSIPNIQIIQNCPIAQNSQFQCRSNNITAYIQSILQKKTKKKFRKLQ